MHVSSTDFFGMLADGLEWCGLLVDCCDVFVGCLDSRSGGAHSHPLVSGWCGAAFLRVWWGGGLLCILDGLGKSLKLKEQEAAKEQEKTKTVETSAEKLRKILKEDKRMKKKRKRSTSSSTSSDTSSASSDDSSSTSRKKSKKRKHKRRRSSHGSKKHKRRVSSCSDKMADDDIEWFPAPANTSASYIDQKQSISKLISEGEQSWEKSRCEDARGRLDDAIDRSLENLKHGAQSEASRLGRPDVNGEVRDQHRTPSTSECARNRRDSSSSTQSEYSQKSDRYSKEFSSQGRKRSESERGGNEKMDRGERSSRDQDDGRRSSGGSLKKDIPSNLLDLFSQIAEFEKGKKLKK